MRYEKTGLWVEFKNRVPRKTPMKTPQKILDLIRKNPAITTRQMADEIGITRKGIEWQIAKFKQAGELERVGSKKSGVSG